MKKIIFFSFLFFISLSCISSVNCPTDLNGDGITSNADLNALLLNFGSHCSQCPADITGDGLVSGADLSQILLQFGQPCANCVEDNAKNWVHVKSLDGSGQTISEVRTFMDGLGRTTQVQSWNPTQNYMMGAQTVFDAFGRSALQTLPAPVYLPESSSSNHFCYKDKFISNSSNLSYSYTDFDTPSTFNSPGTVYNSTPGTLGWYYSNNNTAEPYAPASAYPYAFTEYYKDPLSRVKRVSAPGENYRMGSGHEQRIYYMSNAGELYYAFGYKGSAIIGNEHNGALYKANENLNAAKTITVDPDGNVTVSYTTLSGLTIATCRSGAKDASCINQKVSQKMLYAGEKGISIHLPPSCTGTLKILGVTETDAAPKASYQITDLNTGKLLVQGSDYTFSRTTRAVTFSSAYQNKHLFLRISFDYLPLTNPSINDYLTVAYELDYDNWSLQLYNPLGQPVVTVPPVAMNCAYDAVVSSTVTNSFKTYTIDETLPAVNQSLETINLNNTSGIDKNVTYTITGSSKRLVARTSGTEDTTFTYTPAFVSATDDLPGIIMDTPTANLTSEPAQRVQTIVIPPDPNIKYFGGAAALTFQLYSNTGPISTAIVPKATLYLNVGYQLDRRNSAHPYTIREIDSIPGMAAYLSVSNKMIADGNYTSLELRLVDIQATSFNIMGAEDPRNVYYHYTFTPSTQVDTIVGVIIDKIIEVQKINVARELLQYPTPNPYNKALVTTTFYNKLGWPIKTVSPDEGTVNVVYNTEGKIRFSQNQQQALSGKFSYINYDRAGRVVETGEYDPAIAGPPGTLYTQFIPYTASGDTPPGSSVHTLVDNLDWTPYNISSTQQTYYKYDLPQTDFPANLTTYAQNYKDGQLSKTSNSKGTTWYGYNDAGQPLWKINSITGLGIKTVNYTYNRNYQLDKLDYQKETAGERFVHQYTYDVSQQLQQVTTSFNDVNLTLQQTLFYYLHGTLKRNELGGSLQGLDYVYTINGQLKSVNDPTLSDRDPGKDSYTGDNSSFKKDVFGYTLDYFTNDYTRQNTFIETYTPGSGNTSLPNLYGGQVRDMRWQTTLPANANSSNTTHTSGMLQYAYKYDTKNQLTEAIFGAVTAGTINGANTGTSPVFAEEANEYRVNNIQYDRNGNIQFLKRQARNASLAMDDFTYNYSSTLPNRLLSINDAVTGAYADDIKSQPVGNYQYNSIGQLTKDVQVDYNYTYNLAGNVTAVRKTNGIALATFEYNEAGLRQKKTAYDGSGNATMHTWYVYDAGGTLLSTHETNVSTGITSQKELQVYGAGRLGVYSRTSSSYIYELTDHLGNVRATIRNNAGNVEVMTFADYYPHGSVMPWRSYQPDSYRFGYQGQEKDKDEPAFINFELRQYDPRIGRWFNPDPMGQYHSPYLAMGNNPISFIDPTGGTAGQFDPMCGCVLSSNDMIVKPPRDPYGFFSGSEGHFYQAQGSGDNAASGSFSYSYTISPEQEAANKQRMQNDALQTIKSSIQSVLESRGFDPGAARMLMSSGNNSNLAKISATTQNDFQKLRDGIQSPGIAPEVAFGLKMIYGAADQGHIFASGLINGANNAVNLAGEGVSKGEYQGAFMALITMLIPGAEEASVAAKESTLFHYTSEAGYNAIMKSGELLPSIGIKNARHGIGVYLTDIAPGQYTLGQTSRRLFGVPWNTTKLTHFIEIDVSGLNTLKNAPFNYFIPGTESFPLGNRIVNHGVSIFK